MGCDSDRLSGSSATCCCISIVFRIEDDIQVVRDRKLSSKPTTTFLTMSDSRAEYAEAGQDHVLIFYDSLGQAERAAFDTQLKSISPSKVNMVYAHAVAAAATPSDDVLAPPPTDSFDSIVGKPELAELWNEIGLEAIRQGQVGVLLMAGGQGSRLGSSAPKGCYDIGLPSHKSLFQLQAERISRLQVIAGRNAIVPWYIMTSGPTRAPTEQFFKDNNYFGLASENVVFFEQGIVVSFSRSSMPTC